MGVSVVDGGGGLGSSSESCRSSSAVAALDLSLRDSQYEGSARYDGVLDPGGHRTDFVGLVERARAISRGVIMER